MSESTKNKIGKKSIDETTGAVTFTFSNGETRTVNMGDFPQPVQVQLAGFGISTKLGNAYAGVKSVDEAIEEFDTLYAQLARGDWRAVREGAGGAKGGKTVTALFRIAERQPEWAQQFMSITEVTKSAVREWYVSQDDDMKKTVSTSRQIKAELAAMLSEEASSGADLMA